MKKTLLSVIALLVALMLVVLTGCEKEVERKKDDDKTTKAETTEKVADEDVDTDANEEGEGNVVEEDDKDNGGKKPSTNTGSGITSSDEFFDNDAGKDDKEPTDYIEDIVNNEEKYADEDDEEIVKSGKFIMAVRQVDANGVVSVIRMARKDNNLAVFMDSPTEKMGIIFAGENIHMIMTDEKAYITLPMEMLGQDPDALMAEFNEIFAFSGDEDEDGGKEYTEVIDGVEYTVHESEDGTKTYCIGNKIIMGETSDGGMMYMDELSGDVPDSVFEVPAGYREMSITEFAEMMQ